MGVMKRLLGGLRQGLNGFRASKRKRVIRDYIDMGENLKNRVLVDENVLPHPKSEIQSAMLEQMAASQTGRGILCSLYCGTAIFQPKVSTRDADELLACVQRDLAELELHVAHLRPR